MGTDRTGRLALTVSGCSSSSGGTAASGDAPAATADSESDSSSDSDQSFDKNLASRICTALSKKTAELQMANAEPVPAQAQISLALADVYGDDVDQMDAGKIETMTKETCPEVHDEALKTMDKESFDQLS